MKHQREIMYQTGHTSLKVFNGYYDVKPSDLWKSGNEMYFGFNLSDVKEVKSPKKKTMDLSEMDNKLEQLKSWFEQDKIDEEEYKSLRKKILNI